MGSRVQHSSGEAVSADEPDDTNDMSFPEFQESLVAISLFAFWYFAFRFSLFAFRFSLSAFRFLVLRFRFSLFAFRFSVLRFSLFRTSLFAFRYFACVEA